MKNLEHISVMKVKALNDDNNDNTDAENDPRNGNGCPQNTSAAGGEVSRMLNIADEGGRGRSETHPNWLT